MFFKYLFLIAFSMTIFIAFISCSGDDTSGKESKEIKTSSIPVEAMVVKEKFVEQKLPLFIRNK